MPEATGEKRPPRWREKIARLKLWQIIVGPLVVGILILLLSSALRSGETQTSVPLHRTASQPPPAPPENLSEQVEQRSVWASPPQVFDSVNELEINGGYAVAEIDELGVVTVTPTELADRGVDYEGRDIVLVGRVVSDISVEAPYFDDGSEGFGDEARLAGAHGTTAYVGASVGYDRGWTIYAVGRLAALGTTRDEDHRLRRAAYFVAMDVGSTDLFGMSESFKAAVRTAHHLR